MTVSVDDVLSVDGCRPQSTEQNLIVRIRKSEAEVTKKYVLSDSESVQCNFFIFDHVTFIQFKICCCVQNFIKIGWFCTAVWRYNDFQNGGRTSAILELFYHHTRPLTKSLLLAAAACQISCQSHTQIWIFRIWLEMPIQAPKMGVLGDFGPINVIIHHQDPKKAHPCVNTRPLSYHSLTHSLLRLNSWGS